MMGLVIGSGAVGGNDANTKLLLHFDGSDGSTTVTDSSASGRTITVAGNAQLDTAQKVFGTASLLGDATGDYVSAPDHADWTPAGDFTFDARIRVASLLPSTFTICCHETDNDNNYRFLVGASGALTFVVRSSASNIINLNTGDGTISTGVWYHVAIVRSGNTFTLYINGVASGTDTDSDAIPNFTGTFKVGGKTSTIAQSFEGWIDEFRFSNVARWTANFTPPTGPYSAPP
jgi:hypothetical protein